MTLERMTELPHLLQNVCMCDNIYTKSQQMEDVTQDMLLRDLHSCWNAIQSLKIKGSRAILEWVDDTGNGAQF
jgi:hypothetical protein